MKGSSPLLGTAFTQSFGTIDGILLDSSSSTPIPGTTYFFCSLHHWNSLASMSDSSSLLGTACHWHSWHSLVYITTSKTHTHLLNKYILTNLSVFATIVHRIQSCSDLFWHHQQKKSKMWLFYVPEAATYGSENIDNKVSKLMASIKDCNNQTSWINQNPEEQ
jgi:hypothetical protein